MNMENMPQTGEAKKEDTLPRWKKWMLPGMVSLVCILLAVTFWFLLPRVPEGVETAGIQLGGMTGLQVKAAVNNALGKDLKQQNMELLLPQQTLVLTPEDTAVTLDIDGLAEAALSARSGETLDIAAYLTAKEDAIVEKIEAVVGSDLPRFQPASYARGEVPPLEEDAVSLETPAPELRLNAGTAGYAGDGESLCRQVMAAYSQGCFSVDAVEQMTYQEPEKLDLSKIRRELSIAPENAALDSAMAVIPGSYGLDFDPEEAARQLAAAAPGEDAVISMTYTVPDVLGEEAYFQDILGFCQTPHSDNAQRNENLRLACASLNGVVLQPGETLSYNATLGKRTKENGYQAAPAYSGTRLVDSLGGGICQVSSTLYLCSLYAELETVERVNHGFPVGYIPLGLDATVSWGKPDLRISNPYDYPIRIVAESQEEFVCVWIQGTELRDYTVRMGFRSSDRFARSYVCKYDAAHNQISKEEYLFSAYLEEVLPVGGEIGPGEYYRFGNTHPRDIPTPAPETLAAARRNISPNTLG